MRFLKFSLGSLAAVVLAVASSAQTASLSVVTSAAPGNVLHLGVATADRAYTKCIVFAWRFQPPNPPIGNAVMPTQLVIPIPLVPACGASVLEDNSTNILWREEVTIPPQLHLGTPVSFRARLSGDSVAPIWSNEVHVDLVPPPGDQQVRLVQYFSSAGEWTLRVRLLDVDNPEGPPPVTANIPLGYSDSPWNCSLDDEVVSSPDGRFATISTSFTISTATPDSRRSQTVVYDRNTDTSSLLPPLTGGFSRFRVPEFRAGQGDVLWQVEQISNASETCGTGTRRDWDYQLSAYDVQSGALLSSTWLNNDPGGGGVLPGSESFRDWCLSSTGSYLAALLEYSDCGASPALRLRTWAMGQSGTFGVPTTITVALNGVLSTPKLHPVPGGEYVFVTYWDGGTNRFELRGVDLANGDVSQPLPGSGWAYLRTFSSDGEYAVAQRSSSGELYFLATDPPFAGNGAPLDILELYQGPTGASTAQQFIPVDDGGVVTQRGSNSALEHFSFDAASNLQHVEASACTGFITTTNNPWTFRMYDQMVIPLVGRNALLTITDQYNWNSYTTAMILDAGTMTKSGLRACSLQEPCPYRLIIYPPSTWF